MKINPPKSIFKEKKEKQNFDIEKDSRKELSEVLKLFKKSAKNEHKIFVDNTDSEYWFCVCFQNREQKDEFLKKTNLMSIGDKYLDGMKVAKKLDITLESKVLPSPKFKIDPKFGGK